MQIPPSTELSPFIKHYLFLDSKGNDFKKLRLFSDANTGLVFSFKSKLISNYTDDNHVKYTPNAFLYGQFSEFMDIYAAGEISIAVIVFKPFGVNQLLRVPADELLNKIVPVEDLFGNDILELHQKLASSTVKEKVDLLNQYFISFLRKNPIRNQLLIVPSLNFILENKGKVSVQELVEHSGYTERHIERLFLESVGLNPKNFCNIVKLHSFLKQLKSKSKEMNITQIAYEAGYSDQSHLNKAFKKYTGMTPKEYLNRADALTVNFIHLPGAKE